MSKYLEPKGMPEVMSIKRLTTDSPFHLSATKSSMPDSLGLKKNSGYYVGISDVQVLL